MSGLGNLLAAVRRPLPGGGGKGGGREGSPQGQGQGLAQEDSGGGSGEEKVPQSQASREVAGGGGGQEEVPQENKEAARTRWKKGVVDTARQNRWQELTAHSAVVELRALHTMAKQGWPPCGRGRGEAGVGKWPGGG